VENDMAKVLFASLFGLVMGCFLNTLEYRIRTGANISTRKCYCPSCGRPIRLRDQIPVIGYLLLHGKCRDCKASIGIHYPGIEAGTAFFYGLTVVILGSDVFMIAVVFWLGLSGFLLLRLKYEHSLRLSSGLLRGLTLLALYQLPIGIGIGVMCL